MSARGEILGNDFDGIFDGSVINKWLTPIAWSGTVSQERRAEYEAARRELCDEAIAAFEDGADGVTAIEVRDGVIVAAIKGEDAVCADA